MTRRGVFIALAAALTIGAAPAYAREVVSFNGAIQPGTIVIKTAERRLYLVLGDGTALRYPVAVGRPGKQWQGETQVSGKFVAPAWSPPEEVRADNPSLPDVIAGGSPHNPMGAGALTLAGGEYA